MPSAVTLREVLALPSLGGARVIAGAAGLDRPVRRVNVMEVPDILAWVKEDELLLTTAYPLRDDPDALLRLVPSLADRGLAGLALKPARYIAEIPGGMLEAADARGFPIVELPADSSFNEIINSVLTVILNRQALHLQRSAEIHERFTSIVLGGGGLPQIATALADAVSRPVLLIDASGTMLTGTAGTAALGAPGDVLEPVDAAALETPADAPDRAAPARLRGRDCIVKPIQVGGERFGAVVVLLDGIGQPGEEELDAIEYAATVAALRQVQARAVAEADRRFQAVCLDELVTGHVDREVLTERAQAFKWDLSVPRTVLLAQLDELDGGGLPLVGTTRETAAVRRLADVVRTTLGRDAIVWERSADVAALVAAPGGAAGPLPLRRLGEAVLAEAGTALPTARLTVGIGRTRADPLALAASFTEARRAVEIGRRTRGPGHVAAFEELGADRLLAGLSEAELADFAASQLGPLLEHDRRHGTALVETLDVYLGVRNAALAARRLFVHYNTLKHRLRAIEELIGPFTEEPDKCLDLALALRIRRLPRA